MQLRPLLVLACAGCADLPTAAALQEPQLLALVSDPPCVPPGGTAQLSVLVAGPAGTIDPSRIAWTAAEDAPVTIAGDQLAVAATAEDTARVELVADVEVQLDADAEFDIAASTGGAAPPADVDDQLDGDAEPDIAASTGRAAPPADVDVQLDANAEPDIAASTGRAAPPADGGTLTLRGVRTLTVGTCTAPALDGLLVDGAAVAAAPLALTTGSVVALDIAVAGGPAAEGIVSWFTTAGAIDRYRRTPTELVVRDTPGMAMLYVVYRDGRGGVAWIARDVRVVDP